MKTRSILALVMVVGLVLAACSTTNPLDGTRWYLESLADGPLVPETTITMDLEEGRIHGTDGCNRYSGAYRVRNDRWSVDKEIATTLMACPEPVMEQAQAYMKALTEASRYKLDGERLTLLDRSGNVLATFRAQNQDLAGTSWTVTNYNNGEQAVVSVLAGSQLTAEFDADGALSGSAGCNRYTATYVAQEQSLSIGPVASTRMMCADPAGVMEQEAQFLKALETVATYRIDSDRLELRTVDGALALSLSR